MKFVLRIDQCDIKYFFRFTDTLSKLQQIVLCDSAKILDEGEQKSNKYKEN